MSDTAGISDPDTKWTWTGTEKREWKEVKTYKKFYRHWYNSSVGFDFPGTFPYGLSLGVESVDISPSGNLILITKSYDDMFHRLMSLREVDTRGGAKGAVLVGQPGTGKSTFLFFVLARLFSTHQVALLCNTTWAYLFYRGKVYRRPATNGFWDLPENPERLYSPIFALIDVGCGDQGPNLGRDANVWPIQVSSPNPAQWKHWIGQNRAAALGMPLWSTEELMQGTRLQHWYSDFRSTLQKYLLGDNLAPPTPEIAAALEVLQTESMRKKAEEVMVVADVAAVAEVRTVVDDDFGGAAMDQDEKTVDKPGQKGPADIAIEILVCNAIEEFGCAPRDVYEGVFRLPQARLRHITRVEKVNYSKLKNLVDAFSLDRGLDKFSHHVVAVKPFRYTLNTDRWEIHFKSTRIARRVVELMRSQEDDHIRDMYALFHQIPESSCLTGSFFESIAHRVLSRKYTQPIPMLTSGNPPTFSTHGTPLSPSTPPRDHVRDTRRLDLLRELSSVTLSSGKYYVSTSATNPLFDSFTIDIDADRRTAAISVFQITASPRHGGSSDGYLLIRNIMRRVRKCLGLGNREPGIKVSYFLVCPDDGSHYQWNMPPDWNKNAAVNDHRGEAYCIRIPSEDIAVPPCG